MVHLIVKIFTSGFKIFLCYLIYPSKLKYLTTYANEKNKIDDLVCINQENLKKRKVAACQHFRPYFFVAKMYINVKNFNSVFQIRLYHLLYPSASQYMTIWKKEENFLDDKLCDHKEKHIKKIICGLPELKVFLLFRNGAYGC